VEEKTYERAVLCCSQERHWESFHWVNALLLPLHVDTDICIWLGSVCIGSAFEFCTSHLFCAMVKFVFKVNLSFSMVRSMSVWRNVLTTYSFCLCERIPFEKFTVWITLCSLHCGHISESTGTLRPQGHICVYVAALLCSGPSLHYLNSFLFPYSSCFASGVCFSFV
jgi:hypothetical protein